MLAAPDSPVSTSAALQPRLPTAVGMPVTTASSGPGPNHFLQMSGLEGAVRTGFDNNNTQFKAVNEKLKKIDERLDKIEVRWAGVDCGNAYVRASQYVPIRACTVVVSGGAGGLEGPWRSSPHARIPGSCASVLPSGFSPACMAA